MELEQTDIINNKRLNDLSSVKLVLRDKYVSIIEKGKVIFFVIDKNGVICYASDYVKEILHFAADELVGKKMVDMIEPASIPYFNETLQQVKDDISEPVNFKDLVLYCVECQRHYFDGMITQSEVFPESHFVIYLHDVTDHKMKEEHLIQTNLELDGFIYKASHDLRAPLASLSGLIELSEKSATAQSKEYMGLMKRSIDRLDQYILKLAQYTRNNNLSLEYDEITFKPLIEDIIEAYKFLPNAERIHFKVVIDEGSKVHGDQFRLQLILNNLISNAVKYSNPNQPNPYIEISVISNIRNFELTISDNGIGIEEEYMDKIFNIFQRATSQSQGSGIGLYLVKKALAKINGKIDVKSKYGEGTTFTMVIPNHFEDCLVLNKQSPN